MSNENAEALIEGALTHEERDTLGELTSIAMGAAGSTLGILLGQELEIPPATIKEYASLADMDIPFGDTAKSLIMVQYTKGIYSTALFILKNQDARKLAEMMLGSLEPNADDALNDVESGALSEIMNQMMNAAATGLASALKEAIEINSPEVIPYSSDMLAQCLPQVLSEPFIANEIQLKNTAGESIELIELRVASEIKTIVSKMLSLEPDSTNEETDDDGHDDEMGEPLATKSASSRAAKQGSTAARNAGRQATQTHTVDPVTVRPVEYASFDHQPNVFGEENKNLEMVLDVTLNLAVELGKTDLSIKEVLELTRGSVIELDRIAGEPVDLLANGKLIAKGEVVVIEDNFGLRITSIVSPADRLRGL